jgi:hypothetical protein
MGQGTVASAPRFIATMSSAAGVLYSIVSHETGMYSVLHGTHERDLPLLQEPAAGNAAYERASAVIVPVLIFCALGVARYVLIAVPSKLTARGCTVADLVPGRVVEGGCGEGGVDEGSEPDDDGEDGGDELHVVEVVGCFGRFLEVDTVEGRRKLETWVVFWRGEEGKTLTCGQLGTSIGETNG